MARKTNKELITDLRRLANLVSFAGGGTITVKGHDIFAHEAHGYHGNMGDFIREHTRLYRDSWLAPVLDEIEKRLVK